MVKGVLKVQLNMPEEFYKYIGQILTDILTEYRPIKKIVFLLYREYFYVPLRLKIEKRLKDISPWQRNSPNIKV